MRTDSYILWYYLLVIYDTDRFSAEVFSSFLFFFLFFMQASQFEREHYAEDTDDKQCISDHVNKREDA